MRLGHRSNLVHLGPQPLDAGLPPACGPVRFGNSVVSHPVASILAIQKGALWPALSFGDQGGVVLDRMAVRFTTAGGSVSVVQEWSGPEDGDFHPEHKGVRRVLAAVKARRSHACRSRRWGLVPRLRLGFDTRCRTWKEPLPRAIPFHPHVVGSSERCY